MLLSALDRTIVAPALPTIGGAVGNAVYLPWVVTASFLTSIVTSPLFGKVSDLYGRRSTISVAVLIRHDLPKDVAIAHGDDDETFARIYQYRPETFIEIAFTDPERSQNVCFADPAIVPIGMLYPIAEALTVNATQDVQPLP